jgi:hypothetical protein
MKNISGTTSAYTIGRIVPDWSRTYEKGWKPIL